MTKQSYATQSEWQRREGQDRKARILFFLIGLGLIGYMMVYAHGFDKTARQYVNQGGGMSENK